MSALDNPKIHIRDLYSEANRLELQNSALRSSFNCPRDLHRSFVKSRSNTMSVGYSRMPTSTTRRSTTALSQSTNFSHVTNNSKWKTNRRHKLNMLKFLTKEWEIPELPRLPIIHTSYNQLDNFTIYNQKQYEHNEILYRALSPLPPVEDAKHFKEQGPDPNSAKEKQIVIKDHLKCTDHHRFIKDRVVIPTVYPDFFESSSRKKSYIKDMYLTNTPDEDRYKLDCYGKEKNSPDQCQYCDVIGNKYCSFCIEFKNRNFAWGYENNFVPIPTDVREDVVKASTEGPLFTKYRKKLQSTQ